VPKPTESTVRATRADALPYFHRAHRLDPLFDESYRGEGYSCFMAHKYDEAIVQYQKALELEPDAITYFGLVLARAENGDSKKGHCGSRESNEVECQPAAADEPGQRVRTRG
jgi:tetratricopeptide (TPR) repeat protein